MAHHLRRYLAFLGCCVALSAAATIPPQAMPAPASSTPVAAASLGSEAHLCFGKLFYGAMPGIANYCLGVRDWNRGDYRTGLELLKLAAGWGNKDAQYTLGLIYYAGHHVAADPALGIAWLQLADERGDDPQIALAMHSAVNWATPAQRARAAQLFERMRRTYGDAVAGMRAWHHFQHWKLSSYAANSGCIELRGSQAQAALAAGIATPVVLDTGEVIVCVYLNVQERIIHASADRYFRGLIGTVTVEPLKSVPAPAASSGH